MNIKKGDIVGRISYGKDILFSVKKIIRTNHGKSFAILKGITVRIEADSPLDDLEIIDRHEIKRNMEHFEKDLRSRIKKSEKDGKHFLRDILGENNDTGKILHLDGDKKYAEKSYRYYKDLGLNAVVKNIPENKQAYYVKSLLTKYMPDILVITGHDAMIRNGSHFNDIYNYRNSRHFINTVKEAREWAKNKKDLVIFAGACQSYFEALMITGANFASSPGRILIDFIDPLVVAEKVATTNENRYISINEIAGELRDGLRGIGRNSCKRKKEGEKDYLTMIVFLFINFLLWMLNLYK